jgi:triacylglycerol lipase
MSFLVELNRSAYPEHALDNFAAVAPFSLENARAMMWMAQLAYETPSGRDEAAARAKIAGILDAWQMQLRGFVRNDPLTGLPERSACMVVGGGRGATIVAFAGSDPLKIEDWITDLNAQVSADGVHSGFENAVKSDKVRTAIEAAIRNAPPGERALFFTGHSLGGALAIVAADFAMSQLGVKATAVYTFGSPRAGSQILFDRYTPTLGGSTYRLIDGNDVVASVPSLAGVYRHVGRSMQCRPGDKFDLQSELLAPDRDEPEFADNVLQAGLSDFRAWAAFRPIRRIGPRPLDLLASLLPSVARDHVPAAYFRALGIPLQ